MFPVNCKQLTVPSLKSIGNANNSKTSFQAPKDCLYLTMFPSGIIGVTGSIWEKIKSGKEILEFIGEIPEWANYERNLQENLDSLRSKKRELICIDKDLEDELKTIEFQKNGKRKRAVSNWQRNVKGNIVDVILKNEKWKEGILLQDSCFGHGSQQLTRINDALKSCGSFLLILDGMSEFFRLNEVGIPIEEGGGKVVVVSRFRNVSQMFCEKVVRVEKRTQKSCSGRQ